MTPAGFLLGGVIPIICLGLGKVLMRASIGAGAPIPVNLVLVGSTVAALGWGTVFLKGAPLPGFPAMGFAMAMRASWTLAIACMAWGMAVLKLPVSVVAPLTNSNALVAVLVGAIAFAEWCDLNLPLVMLGTTLVCTGATVIALAK
ncbi:hypothetical protein CG50_05500 [Paenirhodobacter enshiensis]|uniref:EamA domain-containing protein n=2 Tax=Paenirhodobacter enshiensis TaxID=1105367 RepID=A0A086XTV0_9RHOB|nr:hypothetical protein CG50_05500 [Paenirhodobacter enshiensis]